MKKRIFIILSIFSILFFNINVSAFELHSYDSSIAIFDEFGSDLPICGENLYILKNLNDNTYYINTHSTNSVDKLCDSGYSPSLDKIKEYFKYYIRINYKNKYDNSMHYIFLISDRKPVIDYSSYGHHILAISDGFYISNFPNNYILGYEYHDGDSVPIYGNDERIINHVARNYYSFTDNYRQYFDDTLYGTWWNNGMYLILEDINFNGSYFDVSISTNFDLDLSDYQNFDTSIVDSFEFNTDKDLKINYDEYVLLIPKRNSSFSSYIWTDSNFYYDTPKYDNTNGYFDNNGAGFDEISFGYLNGFNWFRWDFEFTNEELQNNKIIRIYNHNENRELNIKYFSSDFEARLMNMNSSSYTYNGVTYPNDWDSLKNASSQHIINNTWEVDVFNDFNSYTRNLPNLITQFGNAFSFIGLMITSAFNIFPNEILTYFYVLFGLMLIIMIILIMK